MAKGKLTLTNLPNWLLTLLFLIAVIGQNIFIILVVIFIGAIIYFQLSKSKNEKKDYIKKQVYDTRKVNNKKRNYNNPDQIYNKEYCYGELLHFEHEKVDFSQNNLKEVGVLKISKNIVSFGSLSRIGYLELNSKSDRLKILPELEQRIKVTGLTSYLPYHKYDEDFFTNYFDFTPTESGAKAYIDFMNTESYHSFRYNISSKNKTYRNHEYSYNNFKIDDNGVIHGSLIILKTKYLNNAKFLKKIAKVKIIMGDLCLPKSANIFKSIKKINGNVDLAFHEIEVDSKIKHNQELDLESLEEIGGNLRVYGRIKSFGKLEKVGRTLSLRNAFFDDFENIKSIGKNLLLFNEDKKRFNVFPDVSGKIMSYKNRTNKIPIEQNKLFDNPHLKSKKLGDPEKFEIWEQKLMRTVFANEYEKAFKIFEKLTKSTHKYSGRPFLYSFSDILPFLFFQKKINRNLLNARLLMSISANKYLTQIGIDNIQKVIPLIDEEIKNIAIEKFDFINYNSLDKFYKSNIKQINSSKEYKIDDKEWHKLNEESLIFHKSEEKYLEELIVELEEKIFREVFREAENRYRESVGLIRVGEGWISELLLFNRLKERFPNEEIIRHARLDWLGRQHLDIYLPKHNIGIEYQGLQHYKPIEFFGGEEAFIKNQERDARKKRLCEENECKLIYVDPDYELDDVTNTLKELI